MRASAWIDLPAFDIGDVYDEDGNYVSSEPPAGAHSLQAGFSLGYQSASGSVSYFGGINNPPNIASLRLLVDSGGGGSWNYYPGLEDEWSGADTAVPSPPRDNGPFLYSSNPDSDGGLSVWLGQRSVNENHWLLLGYNIVNYTKHTAFGMLIIPSNHTLANYFNDTVQTYLPAGSGDDSWSWVETNGDVNPTPILPSSVEVGVNISADSERASGVIEIYAHWLPKDDTPISDLWIEDVPRAGWTYVGALPYTQAAGWSVTTIDISGMSTDDAYPDDIYHTEYRLALTLRNVPNTWSDPALGEPADGPYVTDVSWTQSRILAHYDEGALQYRFAGPEVIEGGPFAPGSHIGVVVADTDTYMALVTNGVIEDTQAWPWSTSENAAGLVAVARPGTRVGNRATFLVKTSSTSFHLTHCTVLSNGQLSSVNSNIPSGALNIAGYPADTFGGNESSRILLGRNTVSGYQYAVFDVDTGTTTQVSGMPTNTASDERADLASFSQGSTYLHMTYTDTVAGPPDLAIQRYTISSSGIATAVGPRMLLPNEVTPDRPFDYYSSIGPGDVWDDGDYVAVGILHQRDYPYSDSRLRLAIFNHVNQAPLHILTLHDDPTNTLWVSNTSTIAFAYTQSGYTVSYARMSKRPLAGSPESEEWQTYVTRTINPSSGDLGDEVFGSDSDYGGLFWPLVRADSGSTLAYVERYPNENAYPSKIAMLNANPELTTEGVRTLVPWHGFYIGPPGFTNAYAWVGVNGWGGYGGRLYFKYRRS